MHVNVANRSKPDLVPNLDPPIDYIDNHHNAIIDHFKPIVEV